MGETRRLVRLSVAMKNSKKLHGARIEGAGKAVKAGTVEATLGGSTSRTRAVERAAEKEVAAGGAKAAVAGSASGNTGAGLHLLFELHRIEDARSTCSALPAALGGPLCTAPCSRSMHPMAEAAMR
mmetsp:Transcript_73635/g.164839  ORF Transcript_73635/g.164839 Transcript_73635/m.164839 type:complete len:126 (+) Transcript_73635:625-1002(+)